MTQIFTDLEAFKARDDKKINGVSPEHAATHLNWESDNATNNGCWNCSSCSYCSYCSYCSSCRSCSDCSYCSSCSDCSCCSSCRDCSSCSYCSSCSDCSSCRSCSDCSYCSSCRSCSDCSSCSSCSYCSSCRYCSYCSDFKTDPQRVKSPILGSRKDQTTYYWNDENEQIVCGCFNGTLQQFKDKIKEKHGNNEFAKGYYKWIGAVEIYKNSLP